MTILQILKQKCVYICGKVIIIFHKINFTMNIVFLSPHFPDNFYQFCIGLSSHDVNVLGIGDAPFEHLRHELQMSLTDYYHVDDMEDYDQLLRALGYFTHKYGKIDRFDSLNEYWLDYEARLRTDFNIWGIKIDTIGNIKQKSKMKECFRKAGVAVAEGKVIHDLETAKEFVLKVGYPIVAKPDNGVGAMNTYKIHNDFQLGKFFEMPRKQDFIFEEFISGDIFSFDGLTDHEGKAVFYTSHAYKSGIMETVNEDTHVYYYSLRDIPKDLEEAGLNSLKAFDVRERFFHIEFFRTYADNRIVALEVNMRPPGGYTTDMFNFANDIDIYKEWANVVVENEFKAFYSRKYHCAYVGRKFGNHHYTHSHDEVIHKYFHLIVFDTPVSGVFAPALGNFGYLIRSQNLAEIKEAIEFIHEVNN